MNDLDDFPSPAGVPRRFLGRRSTAFRHERRSGKSRPISHLRTVMRVCGLRVGGWRVDTMCGVENRDGDIQP